MALNEFAVVGQATITAEMTEATNNGKWLSKTQQ